MGSKAELKTYRRSPFSDQMFGNGNGWMENVYKC